MIIDPKIMQPTPPLPINLRVSDMSLDMALEWILKLDDLEYVLQGRAIFISKPSNLITAVELRVYDVSDLTQTIADYPGPDFQLQINQKGGGGGGGGGGNPLGGGPVIPPLHPQRRRASPT